MKYSVITNHTSCTHSNPPTHTHHYHHAHHHILAATPFHPTCSSTTFFCFLLSFAEILLRPLLRFFSGAVALSFLLLLKRDCCSARRVGVCSALSTDPMKPVSVEQGVVRGG
ncbi:hypothetical protein EON63_07205 [archaeon]|nr:MAG: hypothetical protein EON63_07205 [archaeon]